MRRVRITGAPPNDWVTEAEKITEQLCVAPDEATRKTIIDANDGFWRDDRIRVWLLSQFNNKCWYSEAFDSASSIHVDHYRPKCRIKSELGGGTCEGYWWLAFDWKNYRICGQLLNVKKGDLFPIVEGYRCNPNDPVSLQLEAPVLIDPVTDQVRLISYELDEDGVLAVPAAETDDAEHDRAQRTIDILGLNLRDRLNAKRREIWDECLTQIANYRSAYATQGAQVLKQVLQAVATSELKKRIKYNAEFSSIAEACIDKNAPEPLKRLVFESFEI
jgi:hypothetical protein